MATFLRSFLVTILLIFSFAVMALPAQVILIRHAEKAGNGELSQKGQQRAQALVAYFKTNPAVLHFGTPVAIYAGAPVNGSGSVRSIQTVTPVAQALGLQLHTEFDRSQGAEMAAAVLQDPHYDGKMVLVCWSHADLADIASAFGVTPQPEAWDGNTFDRSWVIDFNKSGVSGFSDIPQNVLPGDSQ